MKIKVMGDAASDSVVKTYVDEIMKAHRGEKIREVDIIVDGGYMKVVLIRDELERIA